MGYMVLIYQRIIMFSRISSAPLLFGLVIVLSVRNVTYGMNIDQKQLSEKKFEIHDMNTKMTKKEKSTEVRHLEEIDDVLEHLFGNEEDEPTTENIIEQQSNEALKFFISTKTKTLKTTITSTHSLTSYHTCYKANPDLPICNRRKRSVKDGHSSLLDVQPNLRISLISNGILESGKSGIDLTWQDVISPTRVARNIKDYSRTSQISEKELQCQNPGKSIPSPFDSCNICSCSNEGVLEGCTKQLCTTDVIEPNENNNTTSDHDQAMKQSVDESLAQKENIYHTASEELIHSRHEESPLNLPQDSFGGDWIEREIEGLNKKCYDSGNFANRFITILMTNLVNETAFETTLVESNQVNTVYFNKNEKQEG